jgi:hypothetical protein
MPPDDSCRFSGTARGNVAFPAQPSNCERKRTDMTEERITTTEVRSDARPAKTHTTVVRDAEPRGGGANWLIVILVLVAIIATIYFFTRTSSSEVIKDNAIAGAADDVGNAADSVGAAAENAGQAVEDAAKNVAE